MKGPVRIEVPLPFALKSANCWLWPGPRPLLLDCGLGSPDAWAALSAGLESNGVDRSKLRLVVSHGHMDHAGNAARLRREHGVPLLAPHEEAPFLETFRRDAEPRNQRFADALLAHGMPTSEVQLQHQRGRDMDAYTEDVTIIDDLRPGRRLEVPGGELEVVHSPGHTGGSLLLSAEGELATGDTLLEHITSNAIELKDDDHGRYHQYLETLEGLHRFVGCMAFPGHHAPFRLTDAVLDAHQEKHHRRSARVLASLDAPRSAYELLPRVLPHLASDQTFLGMCEVVGHLHHLQVEGKVHVATRDGVRRFQRA